MQTSSDIRWSDGRTEPDILSAQHEGDIVELELVARANLFQFQGHFPGEPVLPGVAQIDWAARLARRYFGIEGAFEKMGQIKFAKLILPERALRLRLEWQREKGRVSFLFSDNGELCSSGHFVLADR
ncbi:hypothetical protein [uncultured Sneathiella sp.]|uniref:3-hydroxyacyl-ACP dehydratase FabZ family protein n=1 Tax=uncultured Sneathiella sp. TaxID=879315 RepID=UPI0030ED2E93|tara:strand:+ start:22959 stop:23339 length:381 start_codon:yes stop_codon:yes gene_type:complete